MARIGCCRRPLVRSVPGFDVAGLQGSPASRAAQSRRRRGAARQDRASADPAALAGQRLCVADGGCTAKSGQGLLMAEAASSPFYELQFIGAPDWFKEIGFE